jgi:predicted nucleic acid-binding Zn ribbon protein
MKADPLKTCPACHSDTLKRKIGTGAGIIFKGSGFYETDYKKPAKTDTKSKDSSSGSTNEKKSPKKESTAKAES